MQKFLSKKPVMISFIVGAIIMLILTIAWCIRPVSLGYTYTSRQDNTTVKYHFNSSNKITLKIDNGEDTEKVKMWYFQKDGYLVLSGLLAEDYEGDGVVVEKAATKKEYKEWKETILENWDKDEAKELYPTINAFKVESNANSATSAGAIVSVVIFGTLAVASMVIATLSVIVFIKQKRI